LSRINQEHVIGAACVLVGAIVLCLTTTFPKGATSSMQLTGPAFFPNLLAIILLALGCYQIVNGFINKGEFAAFSGKDCFAAMKNRKVITIFVIIGAFIFYILFLKTLGFFITSLIFLLVLQWQLQIVWWKSILTAFAFLGIIYLIFVKIFTISLPSGVLF